jgi:hypothetical protein
MNPTVACCKFLKVSAEAIISTTGPRNVKMFSRPAGVETAAKIATHPSSDGHWQ